MYLPEKSLSYFETFLGGAYFAEFLLSDRNEYENNDDLLNSEFRGFLSEKYSFRENRGWSHMVRVNSEDDEQALNNFFDLWDEFLECRNN